MAVVAGGILSVAVVPVGVVRLGVHLFRFIGDQLRSGLVRERRGKGHGLNCGLDCWQDFRCCRLSASNSSRWL